MKNVLVKDAYGNKHRFYLIQRARWIKGTVVDRENEGMKSMTKERKVNKQWKAKKWKMKKRKSVKGESKKYFTGLKTKGSNNNRIPNQWNRIIYWENATQSNIIDWWPIIPRTMKFSTEANS